MLEPVIETGTGNGAPMVTVRSPLCAFAFREFMRKPTTARIPTAAKTISLFRVCTQISPFVVLVSATTALSATKRVYTCSTIATISELTMPEVRLPNHQSPRSVCTQAGGAFQVRRWNLASFETFPISSSSSVRDGGRMRHCRVSMVGEDGAEHALETEANSRKRLVNRVPIGRGSWVWATLRPGRRK